MKRASIRKTFAALLVIVAGCASADEGVLEFEEFEARAYREPDTGAYIINGDELAESREQLREIYDRYVAEELAADGIASSEDKLIVNRVSGRDDKWSYSTAVNLTYCISSSSFGSRYNTVVNAMNSAAAAWEAVARVNFIHQSWKDSNCSRYTDVVFNVRQVSTSSYLARAFFPSSSRYYRELLISTSAFGNIYPWTLTGILRHELGHALGFRHEHTRPEAGTCYEDSSWRALTSYDSYSVMHYPHCNGNQTGDLVLTSRDKSGANSLYPW